MAQNSGSAGNAKKTTKKPVSLDELWLVNDDPAQLLVQKRLLGRLAATVWDFASPASLMTQARKYGSCPNLVTDFHMPGMNGLELAQMWCQLHPNARVLILSASFLTATEQAEFTYIPSNRVRLLTNFRIPELLKTAQEWFGGAELPCEPAAVEVETKLVNFDDETHSKLKKLGGTAFYKKALERFRDRIPRRLAIFNHALQEGDFEALHHEAHSLKGSCGVVGANKLLSCADKLETAAREKQESLLTEHLDQLKKAWEQTEDELKQILKGCEE